MDKAVYNDQPTLAGQAAPAKQSPIDSEMMRNTLLIEEMMMAYKVLLEKLHPVIIQTPQDPKDTSSPNVIGGSPLYSRLIENNSKIESFTNIIRDTASSVEL